MITNQEVKHLAANPAAGAEISETVPAGETWGLKAVSVLLVQGLTQTPQPILVVDDGTDVVFEALGASGAQAASTSCRYNWAPGLVTSAIVGAGANGHAYAPLPPDLVLEEGWRVRTVTLGIGANTDYGVATLLVVQYGE